MIRLYILESTHSGWQICILLHNLVLLSQVFQILHFSQNLQTAEPEPYNHFHLIQRPFSPVFSETRLLQELHLLQSPLDIHLLKWQNWHFQDFSLNSSFHLQQAFLLHLPQELQLLLDTYRMYRLLFHFLPLH